MIYDAIKNAGRYAGLGERFQSAFNYLQSTDLSRMPVGRYAIDGEDVYIMVQEIALKPWREGRWEAHCRYADIQIVIDGHERMGFCAAEGLNIKTPYEPESDVLFYEEAQGNDCTLKAGEMMIFFPQDAHRPCMQADEGPACVRKAVVKVRLG